MTTPTRCADLSQLAGEPIGGTATTAEHWLLVEVAGTWSRDVGAGAGLAEPLRAAVRAWLEQTPSSRLLFVRRPGRTSADSDVAFVVHAGETSRTVRRLKLAAVNEPADLHEAGEEVTDAPLVLVCGHGTRDACCAQRGTAVYATLAARLNPDQVWISSHQGGHRFAANVLVLPAGIQLGRLSPNDAPDVVARALEGRLELDHLRGRTVYAPDVQVADIAIRKARSLGDLDDLELVEAAGGRVRLRDRSGREHVAVVEQRIGPVVPASCGAEPEPQTGYVARVV